jgi:hypothetical protein
MDAWLRYLRLWRRLGKPEPSPLYQTTCRIQLAGRQYRPGEVFWASASRELSRAIFFDQVQMIGIAVTL